MTQTISLLCIIACLSASGAEALSVEENVALQPIRRDKHMPQDADHAEIIPVRRAMALEDVTYTEGDVQVERYALSEANELQTSWDVQLFWILFVLALLLPTLLIYYIVARIIFAVLMFLASLCSPSSSASQEPAAAEGEPANADGEAPAATTGCCGCVDGAPAGVLLMVAAIYGLAMVYRWFAGARADFRDAVDAVQKEIVCTTACHEIRQFEPAVDATKSVLIPVTLLYFCCGAFAFVAGSIGLVKLLKYAWGVVAFVELSLLSVILAASYSEGLNLGLHFSKFASAVVFLYLFAGPIFSFLIFIALTFMEPAEEASEAQEGDAAKPEEGEQSAEAAS